MLRTDSGNKKRTAAPGFVKVNAFAKNRSKTSFVAQLSNANACFSAFCALRFSSEGVAAPQGGFVATKSNFSGNPAARADCSASALKKSQQTTCGVKTRFENFSKRLIFAMKTAVGSKSPPKICSGATFFNAVKNAPPPQHGSIKTLSPEKSKSAVVFSAILRGV
jgi:hypothetical protein